MRATSGPRGPETLTKRLRVSAGAAKVVSMPLLLLLETRSKRTLERHECEVRNSCAERGRNNRQRW